MVTLSNLTSKEKFFCELLWSMSNGADIVTFLSLLNNEDRKTCESLVQMIILEITDNIIICDEANDVIKYIQGL